MNGVDDEDEDHEDSADTEGGGLEDVDKVLQRRWFLHLYALHEGEL